MNRSDFKLRIRALLSGRRVERELDDELAFHVECETRKLVGQGVDPRDAAARARARFGSTALVADECRDARGTAFVDTTVRDVAYAFRMFRRAPLSAITVIATVGIGLGLVGVVFTILNTFLFRTDAVRNPSELFEVRRAVSPSGGAWAPFTRPQYEDLRRDSGVFAGAIAMVQDIDSRIDGFMMSGTLVTGNFFSELGVAPALGRALMPGDDRRDAERPAIVLSHRGWTRLFASDPGAVGRTLIVNGSPADIVGVAPEGFRGLGLWAPDYWAPLALIGRFRPIHAGREDLVGLDVVGRLKPGLSRDGALAGLSVWATGLDSSSRNTRGAFMTLRPRQGTVAFPRDLLLPFAPLFFAFGLILMIGCANAANLLLARGVARQREIGIRLSLGASRRRVIRQLLTESLVLALAAAALGLVISRVALDATFRAVMSTLPAELAEHVNLTVPAADWRVVLFLIAAALASTVLFGLLPARETTRPELIRSMRGEITRDARPGRARNMLIATQVSGSALLLICSAVFLSGALSGSSVAPGVRTADTVLIDIVNEPMRTAMVQAVMAEPSVAAVSAMAPDFMSLSRGAFAQGAFDGAARVGVAYRFVSPEYFDVFDIDVIKGRAFSSSERTADAGVAIVSASTANRLWPGGDAVGQVLHLDDASSSPGTPAAEPVLPARSFTVVGVTRDIAGMRRLMAPDEPSVFVPTHHAVAETSLGLRVHGDPAAARRALLDRLTRIDPNMGQVMTLRTLSGIETYLLNVAFWITAVLGVLALLLTLSGLFSVLSYVVEQRTKEIGVRMALGATARDVRRLILGQMARPVGAGLLAGTALAAMLATVLMSTRAASQIGSVIDVFEPAAYIASLACIVAACVAAGLIPALRAARIDPMVTLKQD